VSGGDLNAPSVFTITEEGNLKNTSYQKVLDMMVYLSAY